MKLHSWNEQAERLLRKNFRHKKNGATCLFIPLTARSGIKLYRYKQVRDACVRKQKRAHKLGFAPAAGSTFKIDNKETLEFFREKTKDSNFRFGVTKEYRGYDSVALNAIYAMVEWPAVYGYVTQIVKTCRIKDWEYHELVSKLLKNRFCDDDVGPDHNVGRLNKKPVIYDFDHA